jgi:hypothetical protein
MSTAKPKRIGWVMLMIAACAKHRLPSSTPPRILRIYQQVESAYREQMAGHNALLLFVSMATGLMEGRLRVELAGEKAAETDVRGRLSLRGAGRRGWLS